MQLGRGGGGGAFGRVAPPPPEMKMVFFTVILCLLCLFCLHLHSVRLISHIFLVMFESTLLLSQARRQPDGALSDALEEGQLGKIYLESGAPQWQRNRQQANRCWAGQSLYITQILQHPTSKGITQTIGVHILVMCLHHLHIIQKRQVLMWLSLSLGELKFRWMPRSI